MVSIRTTTNAGYVQALVPVVLVAIHTHPMDGRVDMLRLNVL